MMVRYDNERKSPVNRPFVPSYVLLAAAVVLIVLNGCAPRTGPPPMEPGGAGEPSVIHPHSMGPAQGLYRESRQLLAQGDNRKAEIAMERALRIEPGNPLYWYSMGKIKFRQGEYAQAVQFCLKSKSLAARDEKLYRLNDMLIDKARQASKR